MKFGKVLGSSVIGLLTLTVLSGATAHAMGKGYSIPTVTPTPAQVTGPSVRPIDGAPSCVSSDPNHICLGLKLVSYTQAGVAVLTRAQAITLVNGINAVWTQCNIGFQLETFESIDPATVNLTYNSNWKNDGDAIRATFNDNSSFLVVALGQLSGATIGVTEMPGSGVYGSLIEGAFAQNALTVGHELGHYQGLYHITDSTNLMNPYIGPNTSGLSTSQCTTARAADKSTWSGMMRY